jgi:hypothetical protein
MGLSEWLSAGDTGLAPGGGIDVHRLHRSLPDQLLNQAPSSAMFGGS